MCASCDGKRFDQAIIGCYRFFDFEFTELLSKTSAAASEVFLDLTDLVSNPIKRRNYILFAKLYKP